MSSSVSDPMKSGQKAPVSGQYEMVGPRGGRTGVERTVPAGTLLPPTLRPGMTYVLADATKTRGQ